MRGKQKEIRAREAHFISVAREFLLREGYQGVSISRVAEETGFSKGTVYQSFATKESLIVALGMQCRGKLLKTLQKAVAFPGRTRERMVAIGEAMIFYSKYHQDDQRILKLIDSETILERVPEKQKEKMQAYDIQMFQTVMEVIDDAVSDGDLTLREDNSAQGLAFTLWAMIDGSFAAIIGGAPLTELGIDNPTADVVRNTHYMFDAYGWRPLSGEYDYEATALRVRTLLLSEATDNLNLVAVAGGV